MSSAASLVGWEVYAEQASRAGRGRVPQGSFSREGVGTQALVLHSDNGSPMKGATLLATLQRLGVVPSFSRPVGQATTTPTRRPCSKPATTTPASPSSPAKSPEQARTWVAGFVHWYNEEHRHSGIRFVTPGQPPPGRASRRSWTAARPSTRPPKPPIPNAGLAGPATGTGSTRYPSTPPSHPPRRSLETLKKRHENATSFLTTTVIDRFHVAKAYRACADQLRKQELKRLKAELPKEEQAALKGTLWLFRKSRAALRAPRSRRSSTGFSRMPLPCKRPIRCARS